MVDALIISNVILWVVVIVLAAVVLALLRQVGILHERVSPAGALVGREQPRVGETAPQITVADWRERALTVGGADANGASTLIFFHSPSCPVCETLVPVLRSVKRAEGAELRVVLASDGARAEHEPVVAKHGLADADWASYVLSAELGIAFQVGRVPYAVLIDATGMVRARGLVNSREHLESLFEAQKRGVASLQAYVASRDGVPANGHVHGSAR